MRCELTAESARPREIAWQAKCLAVASLAELARSSHPAARVQKLDSQAMRISPNTSCTRHSFSPAPWLAFESPISQLLTQALKTPFPRTLQHLKCMQYIQPHEQPGLSAAKA